MILINNTKKWLYDIAAIAYYLFSRRMPCP